MKKYHKIIAWYDKDIGLWTALYHDSHANQIGTAGYGNTKKAAVSDVQYQNSLTYAQRKIR